MAMYHSCDSTSVRKHQPTYARHRTQIPQHLDSAPRIKRPPCQLSWMKHRCHCVKVWQCVNAFVMAYLGSLYNASSEYCKVRGSHSLRPNHHKHSRGAHLASSSRFYSAPVVVLLHCSRCSGLPPVALTTVDLSILSSRPCYQF
jgi:hypothetical protein